jgi:N-acetylmuramic acid 6-phosphate etherase
MKGTRSVSEHPAPKLPAQDIAPETPSGVVGESAVDPRAELRAELSSLVTESVDPSLSDLDGLSTLSLVLAMNDQDRLVPDAVRSAAPRIAEAVDAISERMGAGGRLIYIGAGTSGRLGILDASECPPTFGTDPGLVVGLIAGGPTAIRSAVEHAEDDVEAGGRDLDDIGLTRRDTVVGISSSGRTPYVLGALARARAVGALTVSLSCNPGSRLSKLADIAIETVVGPEFLAGSTRMKSGTATKLVLNMLSTLTMVRLGKTFGNIMVDLHATNEKLAARSERMVMTLTGVSAPEARIALDEASGSVREAVLSLLAGVSSAEARELLIRHGGRLRAALDSAAGVEAVPAADGAALAKEAAASLGPAATLGPAGEEQAS